MYTDSPLMESSPHTENIHQADTPTPPPVERVGLLTGCQDRHYAFGVATALASKGIDVDFIGGDELDSPELRTAQRIHHLNLRGNQLSSDSFVKKLWKLLDYYMKLFRYAAHHNPRLLHILWNNKLEYFDRTLLMLYYKAVGKRLALTAHNVNQARRDSQDSFLNRITLRIQYRTSDHIFVHTEKMKAELCEDFGVHDDAVTVIPYAINNAVPETTLAPAEAKQRIGLTEDERVVLFFGRIRPYKGIESLLDACRLIPSAEQKRIRLVIAGEPKKGSEEYLHEIQEIVKKDFNPEQILLRFQLIPDDEIEVYFKAADVLVLPYKEIFQSGILFLAYSFGLPVIATDVGSFREVITEGRTGFICKPGDPADLARTIQTYFTSDLYRNLQVNRPWLKEYAHTKFSWAEVAELTCRAYARILR